MEEVLARLRALLRRAAGHATSEIVVGPVRLDARAGRVTVNGAPVKLTSHEYRLLSYLMHHAGRIVSRSEIVEHLYDQDFDRDSNTIEVFVGRLRKKLGVDVIQTARGLGYIVEADADRRRAARKARALSACAADGARSHVQGAERAVDRLAAVPVRRVLERVDPHRRRASACPRSTPARPRPISTTSSSSISRRWSPMSRSAARRAQPPPPVIAPQFELAFSGWYWQITRLDGERPGNPHLAIAVRHAIAAAAEPAPPAPTILRAAM